MQIGERALTLEDVVRVARQGERVDLAQVARQRVVRGRERLEELVRRGERIYGVNTGVGGNAGIGISAEQVEALQENLIRQLGCGTGQPLPADVVRGAMLLRIATFATGASAGASGDLMPSAYVGRVLMGLGDTEFEGSRRQAGEALHAAGIAPVRFASKEALALINGTTFMASSAVLVREDAGRVLRAVLAAVALSVEALEAPGEPFRPWVHAMKGHPGHAAATAYILGLLSGSGYTREGPGQSCYSLRCAPQGLGPAWEALEDSRAVLEREVNSANDNPLVDPETGALFRAGNFYGGHMARLLDGWKIDFAVMANWANALLAVLVDSRFNGGLPANLAPDPGVNSGFKGMQLSATSLACAVRQMAGPSSIHSLPTEQYNEDVVSLGMHAAVTAMDALTSTRDAAAIALLAAVQAVDLRGGPGKLGAGNRGIYERVRQVSAFVDRDRSLETDVASVAGLILRGELG